MSSTIRFTPEFIKACESLWRDGFDKGVNGEDNFPDFKSFFVDTNSKIKFKEEPSYEELEKLPFNPSKCEARVEKFGFAIQCTRSPFQGGCLCKTHQNMLNKLPEGKDIRYGRFNQPRPDVTLDKGEPIKWGPKKVRSKNKPQKNQPKLKVGEMRDYLSSRIPNTVFKDMKKKELTVLYLKELEKDNSSSDEEGKITQSESPTNSPKSEKHDENNIYDSSQEENSEDSEQPEDSEKPEQPEQSEEQSEQPEDSEKPEQPEKSEEQSEEPEDDGKGTGLKLEPVKPKTIKEFKKLFDTLGIDYSKLNGRGAYNQAYDDYLKEQEEEKTEPMSDEEDDDDLQEDTHTYDNASWEGVDYLEDEETGYIFNLKHEKVAKWNENGDDFIWLSEEARIHHENSRP